jgi:hypothetical protein
MPSQLEAFFASTGLGGEAAISIHHRNGQMLARFPHVENLIGESFRKGSPEQIEVFNREFTTTRLTRPVDGRDRLLASRMLTAVPLVVVATKTIDAKLATWRSETKFFVAVAAFSVAVWS